MIVKFIGAEADSHRVSAFMGTESLVGVARTAALVAHYISTSEVRFRRPFSEDIEFYLVGTAPGSLSAIFDVVANGVATTQRAAIATKKLLEHVVRRGSGQTGQADLRVGDFYIPEGDIDALAEATEPSLRRAHSWIDSSNKIIEIGELSSRTVQLTETTKEYLYNEIMEDEPSIQDVTVGALNVNGRTGRVYFRDLGRTVPFKIGRYATGRTIRNLARYLTEYAERSDKTVNIRFFKVLYPDRRLKRIVIEDCFPVAGRA